MTETSYLNFDVLIEPAAAGAYRAKVVQSPAGNPSLEFSLPFSDLELENFILRAGKVRRGARGGHSPEVEAAKTYGGRLFKAVFSDDMLACLQRSIDEAGGANQGLRIRLNLTSVPELAGLPWEYLYNSSVNRFLAVSTKTPIVRYLELSERIRPLKIQSPLNILVVISSPTDYPPLDVEHEWENLKSALADLEQRGLVVLERLKSADVVTLQHRLRQKDYHVFHFIGHGGFDKASQDGVLIMEGDGGRGNPLSGQNLGALLHDEDSLRLAVLNACEGGRAGQSDPFSGVAQSLIQQGIPAAIAMQFEISDEAAITFAHEFYITLAEGFPIDAALSEARKVIYSKGNGFEWGTPVLYMRSPDGRIFDIAPAEKQAAAALATPRLTLVITEGPQAGKVFPLQQGMAVIGRSEKASVLLMDPLVSREHARLVAMGEECFLEDLQSTHGIYVNGQRISKVHPLVSGDMVVIGGTTLRFQNAETPLSTGEPVRQAPHPNTLPASELQPAAAPKVNVFEPPAGAPLSVSSTPAASQSPFKVKPWVLLSVVLFVIVAVFAGAGLLFNRSGAGEPPSANSLAAVLSTVTPTEAEAAAAAVLLPDSGAQTPTQVRSSSTPTLEPTATLEPSATATFEPSPTLEPTSLPSPTGLPAVLIDSSGATMVLIPAGSFRMGYDYGLANEKPVHTVRVDDYYIDRTEVTNGQYQACVESGGCKALGSLMSATRGRYYGVDSFENYPVVSVTWTEAANFCAWRGARLPTEAEWEKAARGSGNRIYPWGDEMDCKYGNFAGCTNDTSEVGSYPDGASEFGVLDLAGNVWEWVADWYDAKFYTSAAASDTPAGPEQGTQRVLRGGSYNDAWGKRGDTVRVGFRHASPPNLWAVNIGFRCAASIAE